MRPPCVPGPCGDLNCRRCYCQCCRQQQHCCHQRWRIRAANASTQTGVEIDFLVPAPRAPAGRPLVAEGDHQSNSPRVPSAQMEEEKKEEAPALAPLVAAPPLPYSDMELVRDEEVSSPSSETVSEDIVSVLRAAAPGLVARFRAPFLRARSRASSRSPPRESGTSWLAAAAGPSPIPATPVWGGPALVPAAPAPAPITVRLPLPAGVSRANLRVLRAAPARHPLLQEEEEKKEEVFVPAGLAPRAPAAPRPLPVEEDDFDEVSPDSSDEEAQELHAMLLALPSPFRGELARLLPDWEDAPAPARCPVEGFTPYQVW